MRDRLDQVRVGSVFPIALPLDSERIVQVVADGHLQVWQRYLTIERVRGRDADVIEPHGLTLRVGSRRSTGFRHPASLSTTAATRFAFSLPGQRFRSGTVAVTVRRAVRVDG